MSKDDYPPVVQGAHSGLSIEPPDPLIYTWADAERRIVELEKQSADARKEIERLESDGKALRTLISQFDAAIRRIAAELTGQACGGVDTGDEINPETGEPYGNGGHTGWLLSMEARKLRDAIAMAYGYLWHVNNEPGTPNQYPPERAAYEARKILRDLMTTAQRGEAINRSRELMNRQAEP